MSSIVWTAREALPSLQTLKNKPLGEAIEQTREIVQETLPPGYAMEFAGQAETMGETFQSIIFAFFLTILITYMVLASQFESFIHPFTIMLALPLTIIGALGSLFLTGNTINIMSLIGMLMLIGLVVKNSILLVDYTNTLRSQGMAMREAVLEAGPVTASPHPHDRHIDYCRCIADCPGFGGRRRVTGTHGHRRCRGNDLLNPPYPVGYTGCLHLD